jgi:hypothetical protein
MLNRWAKFRLHRFRDLLPYGHRNAGNRSKAMTDHSKRSEYEARTHEIFRDETYTAKGIEWSPERQVAGMVWRCQYSAALSIESINRLGGALAHYHGDADLQAMMDLMVQKRMLRRYRKQGRTLYEVNYNFGKKI